MGGDGMLKMVTTRWVLAEVADAMSVRANRSRASKFLVALRSNPWVTILGDSDALFEQGCELFGNRPDKDWSLTDCISFAAMSRLGLVDALTGDNILSRLDFRFCCACRIFSAAA
jgi:uncharacterized protein